MAKRKGDEEDLFEGEEIEGAGGEADIAETPGAGEGAEEALAEETGEMEVPEGEAEEVVAGEAAGQRLTIPLTDVPDFEGLQPGDEADLITTFRVVRIDENEVEVEPIDYTSAEEMEEPPAEEGAPAVAPAGIPGGVPGAPGAGGLEGLV